MNKVLGIICLAICGCLLFAGLWPFNFWPRNNVEWLHSRNGVQFAWQGLLYSKNPVSVCPPREGLLSSGAASLEIWLRPHGQGDRYYGEILSLYQPQNPQNFAVGQLRSELILRGSVIDHTRRARPMVFGWPDVFHEGESLFITVTSSTEGTTLFLNGNAQKVYPEILLTPDDLCGQLVVGHSPAGYHPWAGDLFGVAIYRRSLTSSEVFQSYQSWVEGTRRNMSKQSGLAALYLLNEQEGQWVHDDSGSHADLFIPTRFRILRPTILEVPEQKHWLHSENRKDIVINILGFAPFGFFVFAYLTQSRRSGVSAAILATMCLGGALSLLIELLQVYLPTRSSSTDDLALNALGTTLGAILSYGAIPLLHNTKTFR